MRTPASSRTTLSAWYAGAFALLLSVFAVGAYLFLQHQTQQRIDEYLAETAGAVAGAMEFERVSNKAFDQIVDDVLEEFRMQDIAVLILDRERNRISMLDLGARRRATPPRTHAAQQLPDLRTILTRTRPTDPTTFETGLGDAGPLTFCKRPLRDRGTSRSHRIFPDRRSRAMTSR